MAESILTTLQRLVMEAVVASGIRPGKRKRVSLKTNPLWTPIHDALLDAGHDRLADALRRGDLICHHKRNGNVELVAVRHGESFNPRDDVRLEILTDTPKVSCPG